MSDDYSQEQMLAAAAHLRDQSIAEEEAKEFQDSPMTLPAGPREQDMTLGEAMAEIIATMKSDKFYAELARPVVSARLELKKDTAEGVEAAEKLLRELVDEMGSFKEMNMFEGEKKVLRDIIKVLSERSPALSLDTVLADVRTTRSSGHGATAEHLKNKGACGDVGKMAQKVLKEQQKRDQGPWDFSETLNEVQVTVTIKVPAATAPKDVKCTFKPESLKVVIAGHELQPTVIDGELTGKIDPESSEWHLDGSGENRKLVLDLEKKMGGFEWKQLLKG